MTMISEETMTASNILKKMLDGDGISGRDEMIEEEMAISMRDQILDGVISKLETTCIKGNHAVHIGTKDDIKPRKDTKNDAVESKGLCISWLELIYFVSFLKQAWISHHLSRLRYSTKQIVHYLMLKCWYTTPLKNRDIQ
jgi:hypothetical protein